MIDEEQLFHTLPDYAFEAADEETVESEFHNYFSCSLEEEEKVDR